MEQKKNIKCTCKISQKKKESKISKIFLHVYAWENIIRKIFKKIYNPSVIYQISNIYIYQAFFNSIDQWSATFCWKEPHF